MTQRIQASRFTDTMHRPPTTRPPGEFFVNYADLAFGVSRSGSSQDLLPIRYHSPAAQYAAGDLVVTSGDLWQAKTSLTPHAFVPSEWNRYYTAAQAVADLDARYLKLAGGVLTGPLTLAADPAAPLHPATKQYVDGNFATQSYVNGNFATRTAKGNLALGTLEPPTAMAATPRGATFYGELVSTNGLVVNGYYDGANWHARETGPVGVTFVDWEPGLSGSWFWSLSASAAAGATVTTNPLMQLAPNGQLTVEHTMRVRPNTGVPDLAPAGKWGSSFLTLGGNEVGVGGSGSGGYILINGGGRASYAQEHYWSSTRVWAEDFGGNTVQTGACYATAYPGPSDARLKENVTPWTARGLASVLALQPVSFTWNGARGIHVDGKLHYGVIAQASEPHLPEAVVLMQPAAMSPTRAEEAEPPIMSWDNGVLLMAMVNAFKEVHARLAAIEQRLAGGAPDA